MAFGCWESLWDVSLKPKIPRFPLTFMDESTFCITRAMTVRSLHFRTFKIVVKSDGFAKNCRIQCLRRALGVQPSVAIVCSRPIELLPLPYRTGSTWVSGDG